MGFKTLELTSMSAKDLKNVNLIGKMDPYVIVHLSDDPKNKQKTPVHQDAGTSPSWNYTMRFTIDDVAASQPGKYLVITIKHEQTFGADKDLGEVLVPLKELLDGVVNAKDSSAPLNVTYQVRRVSSGKAQGEFKMTYKVVDNNNSMGSYGGKNGDHQYAQTSSGSASSAHGSYPPAGGYGSAYPPPGVGYPPPQSHGAYPPPGGYPPPQSHDHQSQKPYPPPQSHDHQYQKPYPPPQSHDHQSEKPYPPSGGYPPPSHDQSHAPYPPPGGYPPQSHGAGGYPPQSHGTGVPYTAEGYPPQSHGSGVPYGAPGPAHGYPQGYGGYPPPPQAGYGYGTYPPPGGYPAYPPAGYPQGGYAQKPQKPKKGGGGLGMGLGAGLLGGAVGGLVLGEMMDDAFDVDCDF